LHFGASMAAKRDKGEISGIRALYGGLDRTEGKEDKWGQEG